MPDQSRHAMLITFLRGSLWLIWNSKTILSPFHARFFCIKSVWCERCSSCTTTKNSLKSENILAIILLPNSPWFLVTEKLIKNLVSFCCCELGQIEEGCLLNTVDEIAAAVNQMLRRIEEGGFSWKLNSFLSVDQFFFALFPFYFVFFFIFFFFSKKVYVCVLRKN